MANRRLLQAIVNDYIAAGEPWPADRRTLAAWAVGHDRWQPQPQSMIDQCAKELAEAMRAEMETDPQGRTIHAKYCAKITEQDELGNPVQRTLWFDRSAPPNLMHISLQQRRRGILGDNRQLKTDLDSYNENNQYGAQLTLSFNYEDDLLDMQHSSDYNPDLPPDDDGGDD